MFLSQRDLRGYHEEEGEKALTPAREELQRLGVPFTAEVRVGDPAETIVRCADPIPRVPIAIRPQPQF